MKTDTGLVGQQYSWGKFLNICHLLGAWLTLLHSWVYLLLWIPSRRIPSQCAHPETSRRTIPSIHSHWLGCDRHAPWCCPECSWADGSAFHNGSTRSPALPIMQYHHCDVVQKERATDSGHPLVFRAIIRKSSRQMPPAYTNPPSFLPVLFHGQ